MLLLGGSDGEKSGHCHYEELIHGQMSQRNHSGQRQQLAQNIGATGERSRAGQEYVG